VRAHERLGAVYEAQKEPSAALREYKAGLAKEPAHAGCLQGVKRLGGGGGSGKQLPKQKQPPARATPHPHNPTPTAAPPTTTPPAPLPKGAGIAAAFAGFDVEVRSLAGRGRGVVARRAMDAGDLVLDARPMSCVVSDKYSRTHCHACFQPLPPLASSAVSCRAKCGGVVYCCHRCCEADPLHAAGECQVLALTLGLR
jgi:hypothetical protein